MNGRKRSTLSRADRTDSLPFGSAVCSSSDCPVLHRLCTRKRKFDSESVSRQGGGAKGGLEWVAETNLRGRRLREQIKRDNAPLWPHNGDVTTQRLNSGGGTTLHYTS